jgi:hypothetical protein
MEKKCSKCDTAFTCKNEERGCWCEAVQLSQKMLQYLRDHYSNCLCPGCLSEFSREDTGSLLNETKH